MWCMIDSLCARPAYVLPNDIKDSYLDMMKNNKFSRINVDDEHKYIAGLKALENLEKILPTRKETINTFKTFLHLTPKT